MQNPCTFFWPIPSLTHLVARFDLVTGRSEVGNDIGRWLIACISETPISAKWSSRLERSFATAAIASGPTSDRLSSRMRAIRELFRKLDAKVLGGSESVDLGLEYSIDCRTLAAALISPTF